MTRLVRHHVTLACVVAVVVTSAACDTDSPGRVRGGLVSSPSASLAVGVTPFTVPVIPMAHATCPMTEPFTTSFDLFVTTSTDDVVIEGLTLRFIDPSRANSRLFFSTTDLSRMFGNTRIIPGTRGVFTLRPEFGCGLSTPQSMIVIVDLVDGRGRRHQATTSAAFE